MCGFPPSESITQNFWLGFVIGYFVRPAVQVCDVALSSERVLLFGRGRLERCI